MPDSRRPARPVPRSRSARLLSLGGLAGRVAGNVLIDGGKRLASGEKPKLNELLLNSKNVGQLTERLAHMRGAAMKMGQLLSMDAGAVLPDELAQLLAQLRDQAVIMPSAQLVSVLKQHWGDAWHRQFSRFSFEPVAAASIGQVHEAVHKDGRHLALKVQYPGVRESIDSDVSNVLGLLRLSGLLPKHLDLDALVAEACAQLHAEADYRREGQAMRDYATQLADFCQRENLLLPMWHEDISSAEILCMSYCPGVSLETLKGRQTLADRAMARLFALFFLEFFHHHSVQTDPNLGNYAYQADEDRLVLLDFGAVRHFSPHFVALYRGALCAAVAETPEPLSEALQALGFFQQNISPEHRQTVVELFMLAAEPLRSDGLYDFAAQDLTQRLHDKGMALSTDPSAWHTPPVDVLFLHRKLAGLYLMAAKLRARVPTGALFADLVAEQRV